MRSLLTLATLACLLTACQSAGGSAGPQPIQAVVPAAATGQAPMPRSGFAAWLDGVRAEARRAGISEATLDRAFAGLAPDPSVLELDGAQPEFTRPIWAYLDSAISDTRVANGRQRLAEWGGVLGEVSRTYGVQPEYLVAIWGLESGYGANMGSHSVIRSLATLAYGSRRADTFRRYLLQALQILDNGDVDPSRMIGSWAGAMGQPQFMPAAYLSYAVDYDRDGRRDIWASLPDVFASTANYLASFGWRPGQPWGREVRLPAGFDYGLADLGVERSPAEWRALGVRLAGGGELPVNEAASASIIVPAGHRGPAFLVYPNFRTIMRYNNATSYALAVGHLADRLAGAGPFVADWPRDEQPLSRSQRTELQRLLAARGYDPGGIDGIIGANTRQAIRAFQRAIGQPADGHATLDLLQRLRG